MTGGACATRGNSPAAPSRPKGNQMPGEFSVHDVITGAAQDRPDGSRSPQTDESGRKQA